MSLRIRKKHNIMRHRKRRSRLSMMGARRKATLNNMVRSLFEHERIEIILARAKEVRRVAEPLITTAKKDTVEARRRAYAVLGDRTSVGRLFKEIAPLFKNRSSGYTRIIPTGFRRGDGANMAILELTERAVVEKLPKKKKDKEQAPKQAQKIKQKGEENNTQSSTDEAKKSTVETKQRPISKDKPTLAEEKRVEKAKSEERKITDKQGFMKNIRGLFRKKGDK